MQGVFMTPHEITNDIQAAVKMFGEYNFFDKGLSESMDTVKYKDALIASGGKAAADTLEAVIKLDKKYGKHFVHGMIGLMDDQDDKFWHLLMERPELEKLY
jgi:hypothetical protein